MQDPPGNSHLKQEARCDEPWPLLQSENYLHPNSTLNLSDFQDPVQSLADYRTFLKRYETSDIQTDQARLFNFAAAILTAIDFCKNELDYRMGSAST